MNLRSDTKKTASTLDCNKRNSTCRLKIPLSDPVYSTSAQQSTVLKIPVLYKIHLRKSSTFFGGGIVTLPPLIRASPFNGPKPGSVCRRADQRPRSKSEIAILVRFQRSR